MHRLKPDGWTNEPIMKDKFDRRDFLHTTLFGAGAGVFAFHELLGPKALGKAVRIVAARDRGRGASQCVIEPASAQFRVPTNWTLTYTAGESGMPADWVLMIRCIEDIEAAHNLTVTCSDPGFIFTTEIKLNIFKPRVIWIEPDQNPLPAGETLTVELTGYALNTTTAKRTFDVYEVDPNGADPEIGSELTFMEVPSTGGQCVVIMSSLFNVVLPSRARAGEPIRLKIAAMDNRCQATENYTGVVTLSSNLPFVDLPGAVTFTAADKGSMIIEATPAQAGIIRVEATDGAIHAESNPCVCTATPVEEQVFWGDYHKHSFHCDGNLDPDECYDYARRFAFLDWGCLSSHDMLPAPLRGAHSWSTLLTKTEAAHAPGEMITFQAYEWTHNSPWGLDDARGHKVILFLRPQHLLPLIPFTYVENPTYEDCMPPTTLMNRLIDRAGDDVIVIPHHLPLFKWWVFPAVGLGEMGGPLPEMKREEIDKAQPVAEVYSRVHGYNESSELQSWIKPPTTFGATILDTFWQDALKEGVRAGAMCGGDNHGFALGHPWGTGLTAVMTDYFSREGIFRAIQARRTYGTSGPRVVIAFNITHGRRGEETIRIGEVAPLTEKPPVIHVGVVSPIPIDYVEVVKVKPNEADVPFVFIAGGDRTAVFQWEDSAPKPTSWVCYYLRIHMDDDSEGAWTSPIWLEGSLKPISGEEL